MSAIAVEPARRPRVTDYFELSKSRIVFMVVITTAAGFLFAPHQVDPLLLLHTLIGTAMVAAGTNALNQYVERGHDAKMHRTRTRPLPSGRITPRAALIFSAGIALLGTVYLGLAVNWLTAALGAVTLTSYIFVYTPLKRISTINTIIGAIPGAIPPLMGWTAATGALSLGGWILFGILFLWQMPHFMAISWIHREDYARGGFAMLSVRDNDGTKVARDAILYSLALLAVSVTPFFAGLTGWAYLTGAVLCGAAMLVASVRFYFDRGRSARSLFMISNLYLLTVMLLLLVDARG
ncbi:MAG: heme o synthase [Acidobacteriota bacterium]